MKRTTLSILAMMAAFTLMIQACTEAPRESGKIPVENASLTTDVYASAPASAQETCPIKVGSQLPDLTYQTADGSGFNLLESVKKKPTILIYYRGGWCPYCNMHLAKLNEAEAELLELGYQLLAVSPDRPEELQKSIEKHSLKYTLLSDSEMTNALELGIAFQVEEELVAKYKNSYNIDLEKSSGATHHLLPVPAVFVLDTEGLIRFSYVNPNYSTRVDGDVIMAAAKAALK